MNDNDLERRLRAESGPREQGYLALPLPDALDLAPRRPRRSGLMRGALVLGTVAAGVLAVLVASALISPDAPSGGVGAGGEQTATPSASTSPRQPGDCQPADLVLAAEPWGGAAGSRGTVVTITLVDGRYPCLVQRAVGGSIRDANGTILVSAVVPLIYDPVVVNPGDAFDVGVSWSNWCEGSVAEPVSLSISSGGIEFPVDVPGGADPVPPCLGENQPTNLNVTGLQTGT